MPALQREIDEAAKKRAFALNAGIVLGIFLASAILWSMKALAITSAMTLPRGVHAAAFGFGFSNGVDSQFSNTGAIESLVKPLNKSLGMNDLAGYAPELKDLQLAVNSLGPQQFGDALVSADIFADLKVTEQHYVTGFMWGITSRLSVGAFVPVINRGINANVSATVTNNADKLKAIVGDIPDLQAALTQLSAFDAAALNKALFTDNGYKTPQSFSVSGLGDLQLEARYLYYHSRYLNMQARSTLTLPTSSHVADLSNIFDRDLGEGDVSVKVGALQDLRIVPGLLTFNSGFFSTLRAPSHKTLGVVKTPDQVLPNLTDPYQVENLARTLGPQFDADLGLTLEAWHGIVSFSASYQYMLRGQDMYYGARQLDYQSLMKNTNAESHGLELSMELSTIPLFRRKHVPVPAKIQFAWFQPLKGRNVYFSPVGSFNVVTLF